MSDRLQQPVEDASRPDPEHASEGVERSRLELAWDVAAFQLKLAVDGLRDLVLIPVSIVAGIAGLLFGGSKPSHYFDQVLRFGRKTEYWINLFGHRKGSGTADDILKPMQDKVFEEAERNVWLNRAGRSINQSLDRVGESVSSGRDKLIAQQHTQPSSQQSWQKKDPDRATSETDGET